MQTKRHKRFEKLAVFFLVFAAGCLTGIIPFGFLGAGIGFGLFFVAMFFSHP